MMEWLESNNSSTLEDEEDVLPRKKKELEVSSSQSTSTSSSLKQSRKFNASWLRGRKQWLVYKPEEGMYCSLCQKYNQPPYNRDTNSHAAGCAFRVLNAMSLAALTCKVCIWNIMYRCRLYLALSVLRYQRREWNRYLVTYTS